jgi:hypothetical protein
MRGCTNRLQGKQRPLSSVKWSPGRELIPSFSSPLNYICLKSLVKIRRSSHKQSVHTYSVGSSIADNHSYFVKDRKKRIVDGH